jgi:hypothetical protein
MDHSQLMRDEYFECPPGKRQAHLWRWLQTAISNQIFITTRARD